METFNLKRLIPPEKTQGINNLRPAKQRAGGNTREQNNRNQQTLRTGNSQHQWSQFPNKKTQTNVMDEKYNLFFCYIQEKYFIIKDRYSLLV